jgi:hypothetical protein
MPCYVICKLIVAQNLVFNLKQRTSVSGLSNSQTEPKVLKPSSLRPVKSLYCIPSAWLVRNLMIQELYLILILSTRLHHPTIFRYYSKKLNELNSQYPASYRQR